MLGMRRVAAYSETTQIEPTQNLHLTIDRSPIAELADVLASIENDTCLIWDVRSAEEYAGYAQARHDVAISPEPLISIGNCSKTAIDSSAWWKI